MSDAGWGKLLRLHFLFIFFFFYPNRILKIALWCVMLRLTTKSQWQHAICFCLYWLVRSTRGAQQIYEKKKKLTCGVGWWRRAETSVGHEAVKVKIPSELSHRMIALRFFYHVERYTESSFAARLILMKLTTMAHRVKGVVRLVTMNSTLTILRI